MLVQDITFKSISEANNFLPKNVIFWKLFKPNKYIFLHWKKGYEKVISSLMYV